MLKTIKNSIMLCLTILILLTLMACNKVDSMDVDIDYGHSEIYSKLDMDNAIKLIKDEFVTWEGCELHNIRYTSDECNNNENLSWMNALGRGEIEFTESICFESDFHSPKEGGGAWETDSEYTNWQWWLARKDNGEWHLMTWGY